VWQLVGAAGAAFFPEPENSIIMMLHGTLKMKIPVFNSIKMLSLSTLFKKVLLRNMESNARSTLHTYKNFLSKKT
jgi:hypothetical protein